MIKSWNRDNTELFGWLIASFILVYFLPVIFSRIIFAALVIYIFRTRQDYFWLVLFFILNDAPGRLFSSNAAEGMRLPLYSIAKGISISFQELFTMAYIAKTLFLPRKMDFVFKKHFTWFFLFALGIFLYSLLIGMHFESILATYRTLLPWSWVMIFPFYIRDKETLAKVSRLIFPFVFFGLASQIYSFFTGMYVESYFTERMVITEDVSEGGEAIRSASMGFVLLFSVVQSLAYLMMKKPPFNRNYLILVLTTASLITILSASRGWIIALLVLYGGTVLFTTSQQLIRNIVRIFLISLLFIILVQMMFPVVGRQIDNAFLRLSTMELLVQGDMTAGGTLSRLTERGPTVMRQFWKSPVFGWGFSDEFYLWSDGHVGNQNLLLNVGIIGYGLLMVIFIGMFVVIWKWSTRREVELQYGSALKVYAMTLVAIFIIHSSSTQFWGYIMTGVVHQKPLFYAFFLSAVNALIISARPATQGDVPKKKKIVFPGQQVIHRPYSFRS
jgi:hypothetical protein